MADDHRYSWLDNDAVERLLRGEPVDTCRNFDHQDGLARADADRLAAALDALATAPPPPVEPLPGEDAAVAAFLAVRAEGIARPEAAARSGRSTRAAGTAVRRDGAVRQLNGRQELAVLRTVGNRFGRPVTARPSRLRRPLRAGMVAMLAGCAFGGVAVAAGAGVIQFGPSDAEPRPSSSVTAGGRSGGSIEPELSPGPSAPEPGTPGGHRDSASGATGTGRDTDAPPSGSTDPDQEGRPDDSPAPSDDTPPPTGEDAHKKWVITACRQYLAGEVPDIDPVKLKKLEQSAGGPAAVRHYCERIIRGEGGAGGGADSGGSDGEDSGGGEDGGGDGGNGGNSGGGDGGSSGGDSGGGDGGSGGGTGSPPPPATSPPTDAGTPEPTEAASQPGTVTGTTAPASTTMTSTTTSTGGTTDRTGAAGGTEAATARTGDASATT